MKEFAINTIVCTLAPSHHLVVQGLSQNTACTLLDTLATSCSRIGALKEHVTYT